MSNTVQYSGRNLDIAVFFSFLRSSPFYPKGLRRKFPVFSFLFPKELCAHFSPSPWPRKKKKKRDEGGQKKQVSK